MEITKKESENSIDQNNSPQAKVISDLQNKVKNLENQLKELKKVDLILRESEENFQDIFETVREGIIYTNLRGKVIALNGSLEEIIGIPKEKLINKSALKIANQLLTEENYKIVQPLVRKALMGKRIQPFQINYGDKTLEISVNINRRTKRLTGTLDDITESKKAEIAQKESEARLRKAELTSKTGNWELHLQTGKMYGSEGAMKIYGVKKSPMDFSVIKKIPLSEYRPMMDKALDDLIKLGKPYNIEFKIRRADTGEILDIHSICEYDSENQVLFGLIQDITDRKRAEDEIIRNRNDLSQLLDITLELIETVDKKKVLTMLIEGAVRITGFDSGAIYLIEKGELFIEAAIPTLDKNLPDEFKRASLENHPHIKKAVITNSTVIVNDIKKEKLTEEERIIIGNRDLRSIMYIPLVANKEVVGVLILSTMGRIISFSERGIDLGRTLTNIASLTIENSMLFDNLKIAKEKAEESDRLKTSFLHNVSHEIRTPLNAIIGFSGFLGDPDVKPEEREKYIEIISQNNNQLLSIINDILNISQIESGQVKLKVAPVNIDQILKNIYLQFIPEVQRKNLDLKYNTSRGKDTIVFHTDENKLIQIISNLISNAIKFTNKGYIEIGYGLNDGNLSFFVKDTGIGISENDQEKIFDRFYQVDLNVSRTFGGTGLGLSITKAFVTLLGGRIWVKSRLNSGSVFHFTLPGKSSESDKIPAERVKRIGKKELKSIKSILVAEDVESNYALIKAILGQYDYELIRARDGREAIDLFRNNPGIGLVLMDIKIPVIDGFNAIKEILKIRYVPVIAQTAYAHQTDRIRALEYGCVDYLAKPFNRNQLIEMVNRYIK